MFTVQKRSGWEIVSRSDNGRTAGGASLEFVRWMHGHVPKHLLNTDQAELVEWYDKYQGSDKVKVAPRLSPARTETVLIG